MDSRSGRWYGRHMRRPRSFRWLLWGLVPLALVFASLASAARSDAVLSGAIHSQAASATAGLVYATDPERGTKQHPTFPTPQVWSASAAGTSRHDLGNGQMPLLSANGKYVAAAGAKLNGMILYGAGGGVLSHVSEISKEQVTPLSWSHGSDMVAVSWTKFVGGKTKNGLDVIAAPSGKLVASTTGLVEGASFSPTADALVFVTASSETLTAKTTLKEMKFGKSSATISTLISGRRLANPLWTRNGIIFDGITLRGNNAPEYQLMNFRNGSIKQITHTHPSKLAEGLVPIAASDNGKLLIADWAGTDQDDAYTVNVTTGAAKAVVVKNEIVTGYGISSNGSTLLIDYGAFEAPSNNGHVATIPFGGGTPKVLVKGGVGPDWPGQ